MKWIVQNNFRTDSEDSITIKKACENLGFQYEGVKVIPFSGQVLLTAKKHLCRNISIHAN